MNTKKAVSYTHLDVYKRQTGKSGIAKYSGNGTGFYVRKYLDESLPKEELKENYCEHHWIDMRYAEVLLNGVEAAVEMGQHLDDALIWINDIRDRAGVKTLNSSDSVSYTHLIQNLSTIHIEQLSI